ncbi:MAG: hypothetical protein ABSE77_11665 [Acidimicrobiales bacterium]
MADGPPEVTGPRSAASGRDQAAGAARRSRLRRAAAVTTAGVLLGLVACDVWVAGVRAWWDRHSFTSCVVSSLLVLGVTVLIIDEVLARRQRRERAGPVAVQALIVYGDGALALHKVSPAPAAGGRRRHRRRLEGGQVENGRPRRPAGGPAGGQGQDPARRARQPGRSTARTGRSPGPRRVSER